MITISFVNPEAYTYLQTLSRLLPSENKQVVLDNWTVTVHLLLYLVLLDYI